MPFIFNGQTMYRFSSFSSLFIYNIVLIDWIKTFFSEVDIYFNVRRSVETVFFTFFSRFIVLII